MMTVVSSGCCPLEMPVADLGEGHGPPLPPLRWVKKEEMTEGK